MHEVNGDFIFRYRKSEIRRICETFFYVIILIGCLKDEGYQRKVTFNATKKRERTLNCLLLLPLLVDCHDCSCCCCYCQCCCFWSNAAAYSIKHQQNKKKTKKSPSICEIINFFLTFYGCRSDWWDSILHLHQFHLLLFFSKKKNLYKNMDINLLVQYSQHHQNQIKSNQIKSTDGQRLRWL